MKIGPLTKRKLRRPPVSSSHNVRRHQVGRELNALVFETEHGAKRLDEARLGETGHADEECMPAGQERDQREVDDAVLSENDGGSRFPDVLDLGADLVQAIHELGFGWGNSGHGFQFRSILMMEKYRAKGRGKRNTLNGNWVTIALARSLVPRSLRRSRNEVRRGLIW